MNEEVFYRATLDILSDAQVRCAIDVSENGYVPNYFTFLNLEQAGVMELKDGRFHLTDYGRAFVTWYRHPRDQPQQLEMF